MLNLRLQAGIQSSQLASASDSELRESCTKAEVKVVELQREMKLLQEINDLQATALGVDKATEEEATTITSAGLGPLSFPTLSGMESGLVSKASRLHPLSFSLDRGGTEPCPFTWPVSGVDQCDSRA